MFVNLLHARLHWFLIVLETGWAYVCIARIFAGYCYIHLIISYLKT